MRAIFASVLVLTASASAVLSDPPTIIVQAVTTAAPAGAAANAASAAPKTSGLPSSTEAAIKLLETVKSANAETLSKQQAILAQLDELQKAADQTRIFSHRKSG